MIIVNKNRNLETDFQKKINMGDCSITYTDYQAFDKEMEKDLQTAKEIAQGKKILFDPFVGYIVID